MEREGSEKSEGKIETEQFAEEIKKEKGGFPEDVDFKKFLGCGG
ncbi:hypothetical protein [Ekhidna sp.]